MTSVEILSDACPSLSSKICVSVCMCAYQSPYAPLLCTFCFFRILGFAVNVSVWVFLNDKYPVKSSTLIH